MSALRIASLLFILLGAGFSSCEPILDNNGFDLWCGDVLCSWELEEGKLERVPTWHEEDFAASLVGERVLLSQYSDDASYDYRCVRFELLTHVAADARLYIEADLGADGSVEHSRPVPPSNWTSTELTFSFRETFNGVAYRIRKEGPGEALVAQVRAYADCY